MPIPKRVSDRIQQNLKPMTAVLAAQKARDVSEADTVTLVKDLLSGVFGYDKYAELTSEHAIRGTYCDLAIKLDGKLVMLVEVKAIGSDLKDGHVKQAIDYAANQGLEWVILTNGIVWTLYHVLFKKPIDKQEICTVNLLSVNTRTEADLDRLYLFTKEGVSKNALGEYRDRKDATSRFMLAAILLNCEGVLSAVRREVRRISEISVDDETIARMLRDQVIKRDAIEGEPAEAATRRVCRASSDRGSRKSAEAAPSVPIEAPAPAADASPVS